MNTSTHKDHQFNESALCRVKVMIKHQNKCQKTSNYLRPIWRRVWKHYKKSVRSLETSITNVSLLSSKRKLFHYCKPKDQNRYVKPNESIWYRRGGKYSFLRKQKWFRAVLLKSQNDPKICYANGRVLFKMDHTYPSVYEKSCNLKKELEQTN